MQQRVDANKLQACYQLLTKFCMRSPSNEQIGLVIHETTTRASHSHEDETMTSTTGYMNYRTHPVDKVRGDRFIETNCYDRFYSIYVAEDFICETCQSK
jgi:hypothetical protein